MQTKYLVIGLNEDSILKDAYLSSDGINKESKYYVMGIHIDTFDNLAHALSCCEDQCKKYEHGCKIETVFTSL